MERWQEAAASYEEALSVATDDAFRTDPERLQFRVTVNTNLGLSYQGLSRNGEAVVAFDRAIAASPAHADSYHNRANALYAGAQYHEAVATYTTAVTLAPRDAERCDAATVPPCSVARGACEPCGWGAVARRCECWSLRGTTFEPPAPDSSPLARTQLLPHG